MRRLAAGFLIVAGALAPLEASAPAGAAVLGVVGCGASSLSIAYRGTTGGLAGSFGDLVWVTNVGHAECALRGYAAVSFESRGRLVKVRWEDRRGFLGNDSFGVAPGHRIPWVRLSRGERASFWLFGSDVLTPCPRLTSLVVALPGTRGRAVLPAPVGFTQWFFCGNLVWVNPIVGGESGSLPPQRLSHLLTS